MDLPASLQKGNPNYIVRPRQKRQKASTACSACRARKSKCKYGQPCEGCRTHNTECTFDQDNDRRRKLPLRRRMQSLEGAHELYERLIRTIQESDEDHLQQLLHRLRTVIPADNVKGSPEGQAGGTPSVQRSQIDYAIEPCNSVHSIHRWSSVVDDAAASRLLSQYFNLDGQIWRLVDLDLFLQDLNSGRRRFCSPLLLHALLFHGYSNDVKRPWNRSESDFRCQLFEQLIPLWHREKSQANLTTAQSSLILGVFMCAFGQDKLGTKFIEFGSSLALHIGVHTSNPPCFAPDGFHNEDHLRRAHTTIAWGMYDYYTEYAYANRRTPFWSVPPVVSLSQEDAAEADRYQKWTPCSQSITNYTTSYARSQLVPIIAEISIFSVVSVKHVLTREAWKTGKSFLDRLADWKRNLSERLDVRRDCSPATLCLQYVLAFFNASMSYYAAVTFLCEIFSITTLAEPKPEIHKTHSFHPQTIIHSSMDSLGSLILLYHSNHGWKSLPVAMINYFTLAGVHSISRLLQQTSNTESSKTKDTWTNIFTACVSGLWHMSPSWPLCRFILRMIQLLVKSSTSTTTTVSVPAEVRAIFAEIDLGIWTAELAKSLPSEYIIHQLPGHLGQRVCGSADTLENVLMALEDSSVF